MGLTVSVYRDSDYRGDCTAGGVSSKFTRLCIVNIKGPDSPRDDAPAARLESHVAGCLRIVPVERGAGAGPMMGGNYAATSDGRFSEKAEELLGHRFYGAVPIHDRFEAAIRGGY